MATMFESCTEMNNVVHIADNDVHTPTDQPTKAVKPMAPGRITKHATAFIYDSPGSEYSSDSEGSQDGLMPSKKVQRVLLWGTVGASDDFGGGV
jgi:hypothetical protein